MERTEPAFLRALFCLLLRYASLGGAGFQAALNRPAFEVLRRRFGWRVPEATPAAAAAAAATLRAGSRHEAGETFARLFARDRALVAELEARHEHDLRLYARAREVMCRDLRGVGSEADPG